MVGRNNLVRFEQTDAQQQRQGNIAFDRMKNAGIVLHSPKGLLKILQTLFWHKVAFVQEQDVAVDHLGSSHLGVEHVVVKIFSVDQSDDRIEPCGVPQLASQERHGNRQRVCQAGGFHHDVIHGAGSVQDPLHCAQQLVIDGAADAAITEFNGVVVGGNDQIVVDPDLTELVHEHSRFHTLLITENVIQQGGLSCSQKATENGHWNTGRCGSGCHSENDSQLMLAAACRSRWPARYPGC